MPKNGMARIAFSLRFPVTAHAERYGYYSSIVDSSDSSNSSIVGVGPSEMLDIVRITAKSAL